MYPLQITKKVKNTNLTESFNGPSNRIQAYFGIHLNTFGAMDTTRKRQSIHLDTFGYIWIHWDTADTSGYILIRLDTFGDRRYIWIYYDTSGYIRIHLDTFEVEELQWKVHLPATLMFESVKAFINRVRP